MVWVVVVWVVGCVLAGVLVTVLRVVVVVLSGADPCGTGWTSGDDDAPAAAEVSPAAGMSSVGTGLAATAGAGLEAADGVG